MSKAQVQTEDYQDVQHHLARSLRALREDCPPYEVARQLLSYDGNGLELVGIRHDGKRAVYYQESNRDAIAVLFGPEGLDDRGGRAIAYLGRHASLKLWAQKMRYYWGWRHPRVR